MTRTAGALIGRRRSSAFWGLGCPKTHHEIKDSLVEKLNYPDHSNTSDGASLIRPTKSTNTGIFATVC
ncbi:MAG: hypothetical protein ABW170_13995 [Candidatus Thiodiazotropha sp. L084R]